MRRKTLTILLALGLLGAAAWAQVPTSNVLFRVLKIKTATSTGSAFTIEVDGKQYLITARHLLRGFVIPLVLYLLATLWPRGGET